MRQAGLSGLVARKRGRTTIRVPGVRVAVDLVERRFRPETPDVLWVPDVTYLRTWESWLDVAAVQDAYSRRIRGLVDGPTTCAQDSSSTRCRNRPSCALRSAVPVKLRGSPLPLTPWRARAARRRPSTRCGDYRDGVPLDAFATKTLG
jgi:hypothetical protein